MSSAREEILARVRAALPAEDLAASYAAIPRAYRRGGTLSEAECVELLKDRLLDYDAAIVEVPEEAIASAVASALAAAGERQLLVPAAAPRAWWPQGVEVVVDAGTDADGIEGIPAVLTACEVAIAETGTIVLVHQGAQGRRVDTLLPDHHICVVRRGQVVETVPEGWGELNDAARQPITTISGPSATSDIEMTRIRGVHGPRRLTVLLVA
jgi:L-lactate dehydrogenase complex protein LldG